MPRPARANRHYGRSLHQENFPGSGYDAEEIEWLRAVARFCQSRGRRPDGREILALLAGLGYRKTPAQSS
jgi:hypothetical protein